MGAKKADRWIFISLLAALAVEMLLLLWHLGFLPTHESVATRRQLPAGIIVKNENELRRRGVDSLVWEKSASDESVFYYDSLLTLTQSTATLKLEQETEVELRENTLVIIEPPEESSIGEIRLKFVRGNLHARNPWTETRISAPEFTVDLKAASELQMRQTGEHEFEVQVTKGEASVRGEDGTHALDSSKILRVKDGRGESLALDAHLRWLNPPPARIYFHPVGSLGDAPGLTHLTWEGSAKELRVQRTGEAEHVWPLKEGQREMDLSLGWGDHRLYLRDGVNTSTALSLQIWKAPLLHLIAPLPRDRVRSDEVVSFLWTRPPGVATYEFKVEGKDLKIDDARNVNAHQVRFEGEHDVEWSVWGRDGEGFVVPPLYEYPLFIRRQPLAAPQLNAPRLRKPAQAVDKGAFLWNLLIPAAQADEENLYEAYFSWRPVDGADEYWIEISESPDFRKPVLSKRLGKSEFVWREFRDKVYYWRVAAGAKSGRMGLFSEAAKVSIHEGVEVRKIVAKAAVVEALPQPPAPTPEIAEVKAPEVSRAQRPRGLRFIWKPSYGVLQGKSEERVSANLSGGKLRSFALEKDYFIFDRRWWTLEGKFSSQTYAPKSKAEYPYQGDISASQTEIRFTRVKESGIWGVGVMGALHPRIVRAGPEKVRASNQAVGGVHARALLNFGRAEYQGDFGLLGGSGEYGFNSSHRLLVHAWQDRILLGIGTEGYFLFRGAYQSFAADGFLTLGFEF